MKQHNVIDSPYGPLTLVADDGVLCGLYMDGQRHRPPEETLRERDDTLFGEATAQLRAYFAGESKDFTVDMRLQGTPFQLSVWEQLRKIPYGETRSYGELADALGNPGASRAVGLANGKNPVSIIVPCHRVVGANGDLTGYGGGLPASGACWTSNGGGPVLSAALRACAPRTCVSRAPSPGRRTSAAYGLDCVVPQAVRRLLIEGVSGHPAGPIGVRYDRCLLVVFEVAAGHPLDQRRCGQQHRGSGALGRVLVVRQRGQVPLVVHHAERTHGVVVEMALEVGEDGAGSDRVGRDAVVGPRRAPTARSTSAVLDCP